MQHMKQNYEDKLMLLSSKIITTKRERDEVLANIGNIIKYIIFVVLIYYIYYKRPNRKK